jgi:hypothetical protein
MRTTYMLDVRQADVPTTTRKAADLEPGDVLVARLADGHRLSLVTEVDRGLAPGRTVLRLGRSMASSQLNAMPVTVLDTDGDLSDLVASWHYAASSALAAQ